MLYNVRPGGEGLPEEILTPLPDPADTGQSRPKKKEAGRLPFS
jgi:hypothetical protein